MGKRRDSDSEDLALFRAAMADVTPLKQGRVTYHPPPLPVPRQHRSQTVRLRQDDLFSDQAAPDSQETDQELFFTRAGLQHKVVRKLRRGHFPIDDELDMHGLRVAEARLTLTAFLQHALARRFRVVRIIHGKGKGSSNSQPILKGRVSHWLQQCPEVLAYCSARAADGGHGATYVLLRRTRDEDGGD